MTCNVRRPSPRLGSPRLFPKTEQGSYGVDCAMSYEMPPWIKAPPDNFHTPSQDQASSSQQLGMSQLLERLGSRVEEQDQGRDSMEVSCEQTDIAIAGTSSFKA